ncbi:TPA: IS66 family transposase [Escherichia coli]|nr:IS66 family transposase [Escherichia coli]HCT6157523.1 IS66 family transposase [Escherichia coli]
MKSLTAVRKKSPNYPVEFKIKMVELSHRPEISVAQLAREHGINDNLLFKWRQYRNGQITEAACWAHARRKIHDVHVRTPSALTEEALKRIGELYAIEAEIRGMPAKRRLAERQQKAKPRLKSLESWLREKVKTLSRHSELAKAFTYVLNQWPALAYYTDDGWAEADNNIAENALRMVSLGRKNYLFFGSDHGGERGALLYSLIGTCKLNGVEPESYLRHVLDVIADWPINRVSELLPWRVALPTE